MQLQESLDEIQEANIQLVGVSYDATEILQEFAEDKQITFPLLSDPQSQVITAYGLKNDKARNKQAGIPHPTTIVVDHDLKVLARLDGSVMRRHSVNELLQAVKGDEDRQEQEDSGDDDDDGQHVVHQQ